MTEAPHAHALPKGEAPKGASGNTGSESGNALGGDFVRRVPVFFIRHGETDWNAARRFQGHSDIPLNDHGRAQARANGAALLRQLQQWQVNPSDYGFYTSPLSRARETMEIVRGALGIAPADSAPRIDPRLIEIDLGEWNGKTPDEIDAADPGAFARREENKWAFTVPGGESYEDAAVRTRAFLDDLQGPAIIVGHGASGRLLRGYLTRCDRHAVPHLPARQDRVYLLRDGREVEI